MVQKNISSARVEVQCYKMKQFRVVVLFCAINLITVNSNVLSERVSDIMGIFYECRNSDGIAPCLKMKALTLIDRVSRMEKINIMDGIDLKGKLEDQPGDLTLEEEEKNLPRSADAKSAALSDMIFDRISRMIGSRTIEISIPKLAETARKGEDGLFDKFGGGGGGHGGGGFGGGKGKGKKDKGMGLKFFIATLAAKKLAMIPLYLGALFLLALKALITAKAALLIVGLVVFKKLLFAKSSGGGHGHTAVHHVQAGGHGGYGGGGWSPHGWDRRSIEGQELAYNAQKAS